MKLIRWLKSVAIGMTRSYATSNDIYAASNRFIIKLQHYGIDQLCIYPQGIMIFN